MSELRKILNMVDPEKWPLEPAPAEEEEDPETYEEPETPADRRRAAVLRCCQSRADAIKIAMESPYYTNPMWCHYDQSNGYCKALPDLVDYESTLDFIACVLYGMGISAIDAKKGSKLLYGAQVALTAYKSLRT